MVDKPEQQAMVEKLEGLCKQTVGAIADTEGLISEMANACAEAAVIIERLGDVLDTAIDDLQHMAGCPSCFHNRAPNPHHDIAICGIRHPFPQEGCYQWRGV